MKIKTCVNNFYWKEGISIFSHGLSGDITRVHSSNFWHCHTLLNDIVHSFHTHVEEQCIHSSRITKNAPSPVLAGQKTRSFAKEYKDTSARQPPKDDLTAAKDCIALCSLMTQNGADWLDAVTWRRDVTQKKKEASRSATSVLWPHTNFIHTSNHCLCCRPVVPYKTRPVAPYKTKHARCLRPNSSHFCESSSTGFFPRWLFEALSLGCGFTR